MMSGRRGVSVVIVCVASIMAASAFGQMRITEYMYSGVDGEFVEFTNVGTQPIDMAGWSFDDDSDQPGAVGLSVFGIVRPGESVILTETPSAAFRTAWELCTEAKVIGGNTTNLGRNDQINLYDGNQNSIDRLTYGDEDFPGSFRAQAISAWVPATALGLDDVLQWVGSALGDGEGSMRSAGGDLGSPGRSARATVTFDPCEIAPGAPTIAVDPSTTSTYLDPTIESGGAVGGVIGDPTDPAATVGIGFVLMTHQGGDVDALTVTATSSNTSVVPDANLLLTGDGDHRQLRIEPIGVGYTTIEVRVNDLAGKSDTYALIYAASTATPLLADSTFPTGASDASAAVALDAQAMVVADDENQVLRLYRRDHSGLPLAGSDFTASLDLTDIDAGVPREVDIEAVARRSDRLYWIGSHGNGRDGDPKPNRRRIFATDLAGEGVASSLTYAGRYDHLRADLIAWDQTNGHGLGANALGFAASAAPGVLPDGADGFNIEGLVFAPDGETAYLAFRAPLLPVDARSQALIVPVYGFDALVTDAAPGSLPAGSASFGLPILLDLGGRSLRSIDRNAQGDYLISAGAVSGVPASSDFRLFGWNGEPDGSPFPLNFDLAALANDGSYETLPEVPDVLGRDVELQLLTDNGDTVWYADGVLAKDILEKRLTKFRGARIVLDVPPSSEVIFINSMEGR